MIIEPLKHTEYHTDIALGQHIAASSFRGKIYGSGGCGIAKCGQTICGQDGNIAGIYQRKRIGVGVSFQTAKRGNRYGISRMKFYRPPETAPRIANRMRAIYGAGVGAYRDLTDGERATLKKQARNLNMSGYNLFMSNWLQSRRG